jgi:hypothetical protein
MRARPDDFEEYLRGDSELSRRYRREHAPAPPRALDRQILEMTRPMPLRYPRLAPLALAASVLLSVALVVAMIFGPQSARRHEEQPHIRRTAARALLPPIATGTERRLYSTDPAGVRAPAIWLADIAALRHAGRSIEAEAERRRFCHTYPHYISRDAISEVPTWPPPEAAFSATIPRFCVGS